MNLKEDIIKEQMEHRTFYGRVNSLFDVDEEEKANFITQKGHFHILFDNGYEVSIFNGQGSYTDNLYIQDDDDEEIYSKYVEVAIIKDGYFMTRDFIDGLDDVVGMIDPNELIKLLVKVKKMKVNDKE